MLRIEDTDRERSTPENVEQILDALRWLELDWDEGPIFQTQHAERHAEVLARAARRAATPTAPRRPPTTSRPTRPSTAPTAASAASRRTTAPSACACPTRARRSSTTSSAATRRSEHVHLDDPVIARADGSVLYNFAVAIDDLDAGITHVVRGEDHLSNTPKQLLVLEALGAEPPLYAHLPLLHGPDGKKLSKRHGAASVQELRDAGYLPEAVRNYLALLGWGDADDETILCDRGARRALRASSGSRSNPARFDEQKLRWLNGRYLRELAVEELTARLEALSPAATGLRAAVAIAQEKIQTLADFWPLAGFLFDGPADDPRRARSGSATDGRGRARGGARGAGGRRAVRRRRHRDGAARRGRARAARSRATSSSRCASRSRARRSRRASSRARAARPRRDAAPHRRGARERLQSWRRRESPADRRRLEPGRTPPIGPACR